VAEESLAPVITVRVEGLREAEARYDDAPEIIGAIMAERARALDVSMQLVYRIRCPVGKDQPGQTRTTPHLRDSIIAETFTTGATMTVTVGVPPEQANKVLWLREGTRPHTIVPVKALALHFWDRDGLEVFSQSVNHPGTSPNAWEEEARTAAEALVEEAGLSMGSAIADAMGTKV
jgi:hypothetical protein